MKNVAITLSTALLLASAGTAIAAQPAKPATANKTAYQPQTERGKAAGAIVKKWAGYVQRIYGTSPSAWAGAMQATFAEADVQNMVRASKMGTYEAMMGTLVGQKITDDQVITAMAKSNGSIESLKTLGSPANDLVYTMVTPCRILDTRNAVGRLSSSVPRDFFVHGGSFAAQGGAASSCGIPADPSAVAINVVAVTPDADGFLTIYPSGVARPNAASLNYARNSITSNGVIARATIGATNDLTMFSQAGADVVIDIVGYFMAPEATALDCTNVTSTVDIAAATRETGNTPSCAAGYTKVGSGISTGLNNDQVLNAITPEGFWSLTNNGAARTYTLTSRCCRVPGR